MLKTKKNQVLEQTLGTREEIAKYRYETIKKKVENEK
jgi:hypothetical protein